MGVDVSVGNLDELAIPSPWDPGAAKAARAARWRRLRRSRVVVPVAVVTVLTLGVLLTNGRVEGDFPGGGSVGMSNVGSGSVLSLGGLRVRNQGPGTAKVLSVRLHGSAEDLAGLEVGPALITAPGERTAMTLGRGFPPDRSGVSLADAVGTVLPVREDSRDVSEIVVRVIVTDAREHVIEGVDVTYRQYGRVHRVRAGMKIILCPRECSP